jgi:flagellar protein FliS
MSYAARHYQQKQIETDVSTLNSAELIVLVYEKIFECLRLGKKELVNNTYGIEYFSRASDLINIGLLSSLDLDKGGQIAQNLKTIYEWSLREIIQGRINRSPEGIQEVIDVLALLYEGWISISPTKNVKVLTPLEKTAL